MPSSTSKAFAPSPSHGRGWEARNEPASPGTRSLPDHPAQPRLRSRHLCSRAPPLHRLRRKPERQPRQPGLFLRWQASFGVAGRQTWAARLGIVRLFAQWLHGLDPAHEPPPAGLIPQRTLRSPPYIYSEAEIGGILAAAADLPSAYGLRGLTYTTLFGLIATTGLRISEALALDRADVDLETGVLIIQRGKLGKARLVPLADSVTERLLAYIAERDRLLELFAGSVLRQ